MNFVKEIAPKGILITGLDGGNRKTDLKEIIIQREKLYYAPISVTTCSPTAYGKKSPYYQLVTFPKFDKMIQSEELFEYIKLENDRWFGTPKKEHDLFEINGKSPIYTLNYNGLESFCKKYGGPEKLKKHFTILSLMPILDERATIMKLRGQIPLKEIHRRLGSAEYTQKNFFMYDDIAEKCIDASTNLITSKTDLVPLADAIIAHSKRLTEKLILPKNLVSR